MSQGMAEYHSIKKKSRLHMAAVKNHNEQYKSPRKMISMAVL
jgi:hypothetical protein